MTTAETIDFDAVFDGIRERLERETARRNEPGEVRLWDGNWVYKGHVYLEKKASFQLMENEMGTALLEMPASYYLAKWLTKEHEAGKQNIHITMDRDGLRWDGRLAEVEFERDEGGLRTVRATFNHSYEHLKHIICYSNPWLPPEFQFPRLWILFGPSKWALKTTLMANIMRLESSLWALPDDPLDASQWFDFDQSNWSMVVKPGAIGDDNSQFAIVHSRFQMFHDVAKRILEDAQLTVTTRRYLDGDEPPWEGADLKHGCLVIDIVDKSGWDTETSFGGNLFTGLVRAFIGIADGYNSGEEIIEDPTFPEEYSIPGHHSTNRRAPHVILRDGDQTAIESSSFKRKQAGAVGFVTGGHSMPGVNELISAAIQMAGDLTAMMIGVPPLGGVADAILAPLYTDVVLAFMKHRDIGRANALSSEGFYLHEVWAEGADRAYTLSSLIALRSAWFGTDKKYTHTVKVVDGVGELRFGENGRGNASLGDRIGTTVEGWGTPGTVYVDRITEATISWDRKTAPTWDLTIGMREAQDPVLMAWERIQEIISITQALGVL